MPVKDLTTRTAAEELWLSRKAARLTQAAYAAQLGIPRNTLATAERHGPSAALKRRVPAKTTPTTPLLLALARRRAGGLRELAGKLGVSHRTLLLWERAGDPRLVLWWVEHGWKFS